MKSTSYRFLVLVLILCACSCQHTRHSTTARLDEPGITILNRLRDDTNARYGLRDGVPRVNLGPCGRFAKAFYEQWNKRFTNQTTIVFVMSPDGSECHHVLVKLPIGRYFDGGNGTMEQKDVLRLYENSHIEEMINFDLTILDKRSYGLHRAYPSCPNYSDEATAEAIHRCLNTLQEHSR